jgi:hypothetical protein
VQSAAKLARFDVARVANLAGRDDPRCVDELGFVEVLGAFELGHVADEHAVAHDQGLQIGRAVGVPLSFAAAGQ